MFEWKTLYFISETYKKQNNKYKDYHKWLKYISLTYSTTFSEKGLSLVYCIHVCVFDSFIFVCLSECTYNFVIL